MRVRYRSAARRRSTVGSRVGVVIARHPSRSGCTLNNLPGSVFRRRRQPGKIRGFYRYRPGHRRRTVAEHSRPGGEDHGPFRRRRDRGCRDRRLVARHRAGPRRLRGARPGAPDVLPRQGPRRGVVLLGRRRDAGARPGEADARRRWALRDPVVPYDEAVEPAQAEAAAVPLDQLLPGVPGVLDVGHPEACAALARAAAEAGATVLRGVGDVEVTPGERPLLTYELDDLVTTVSAGLVVGADGRSSGVRRRLGIALRQSTPTTLAGGHARGRPRRVAGRHDGARHRGRPALFRLPAVGRARAAVPAARPDAARPVRRPGPRHAPSWTPSAFACMPDAEMFAAARPAGPCAFYPMNDSWTDGPVRAGGRAHRRRGRLERPDHRPGPVDRAARRPPRRRRRARRRGPVGGRVRPVRRRAPRADAAAAGRGGGRDGSRRPPSPRPAPPAARPTTRSSAPTGARRATAGAAARPGHRPGRSVRRRTWRGSWPSRRRHAWI